VRELSNLGYIYFLFQPSLLGFSPHSSFKPTNPGLVVVKSTAFAASARTQRDCFFLFFFPYRMSLSIFISLSFALRSFRPGTLPPPRVAFSEIPETNRDGGVLDFSTPSLPPPYLLVFPLSVYHSVFYSFRVPSTSVLYYIVSIHRARTLASPPPFGS